MLPLKAAAMMKWYEQKNDAYNVEEIDGYVYCLFSFPFLQDNGGMMRTAADFAFGRIEQIFLLVYDKQTIIADCSGIHGSMHDFLFWEPAVEYTCTESDWMYLEHYTLCTSMFPKIPYPAPFDQTVKKKIKGEAFLYRNAYVTTSYRKHGIFTTMLQMVRDHVLRYASERADLYSVIALDPDIACYGPDAVDEPYIYSYEKDEPLRKRNREIMKHVGYTPVKLEELEPEKKGDGAKLWFALRHEHDWIVETNDAYS